MNLCFYPLVDRLSNVPKFFEKQKQNAGQQNACSRRYEPQENNIPAQWNHTNAAIMVSPMDMMTAIASNQRAFGTKDEFGPL
jgi:hypothetical protein